MSRRHQDPLDDGCILLIVMVPLMLYAVAKVTLDEYPWLKWMLAGSAAVAFLVYYVVTVVSSLRPDAPPRHRPLDRRPPRLLLAHRATVLAVLDGLDDASPGC